MMYGLWHGGGLAFLGMLFVLAATVIVIAVFAGRSDSSRPVRPPEEILAERYARGEISDDEYRQRIGTLRGTGHPSVPK